MTDSDELIRLSRALVDAVNRSVPSSTEKYFVATSDVATKMQFEQLKMKIDRITTKLIGQVTDPTALEATASLTGWRATEDALDRVFGLLDDRLREAAKAREEEAEPSFKAAKRRRLDEETQTAATALGGVSTARADEERLTGRKVVEWYGELENPMVKEIDAWVEESGDNYAEEARRKTTVCESLEPVETFEYVASDGELRVLIDRLKNSAIAVAIDLEHHNIYSYYGYTCLIQMTALLKDGSLENYIVDVLSEHVSFSAVSAFNEVLANRSIYKIFHGAEQDIQWLARDFGVHVVNMFDTGVAARILGLGQKSLKAVIETYFPRVVIDKTHQLSDWRARPLPQAMLHYAVSDTKYLVHIWRAMVQDLLTQGGGTSASSTAYGRGQLRQVVRESAQLCKRSFNGVYDAEIAADKIVLRNGTQKNHRLLVNLLIWRDKLARFMNINCGLVFKERELLRFASLRTLRGVHDIVRGSFGGLTGDVVHAEELWEIWTAAQVQISGNEQEKEETGERPQPEEEKRTLRLEREEVAVVEKSVRTSGKPSKLIDSFM